MKHTVKLNIGRGDEISWEVSEYEIGELDANFEKEYNDNDIKVYDYGDYIMANGTDIEKLKEAVKKVFTDTLFETMLVDGDEE